jgi:hypothetical protein
LITQVVVFEHDICKNCKTNKWMGMVIDNNQAPKMMIGCECDPKVNAWIEGLASLPSTDYIVLINHTVQDFIGELSGVVGKGKLHIRRR